ncbi:MAG TPA: hypothetical protein VGA51_20600 [Casimicrobiaceae bacterium]
MVRWIQIIVLSTVVVSGAAAQQPTFETRMVTGHPYVGRLGTREDVRNLIQHTNDLSAAVKAAADQGKCFDQAMAEIKLPKYEKWGSYAQYLPGNIERFCEYWGRGY